jgi:hypothetical protein
MLPEREVATVPVRESDAVGMKWQCDSSAVVVGGTAYVASIWHWLRLLLLHWS